MALLEKKNDQEESEHDIDEVFEEVEINLTDKMVKVELVEELADFNHAEIREVDDMIRITSDGILIALVDNQGNAYEELKPYVGTNPAYILLRAKTGDHGAYYSAHLAFHTGTIAEF